MNFKVDLHTHTISSGHSYSSINEIFLQASIIGMEAVGISDHGPAICGAPNLLYFYNMKIIPDIINGVRLYRGVEANIIDYDGNVDIPNDYLKRLDYAIASFHSICIEPKDIETNTKALINVMKNPYIDIIGHPGNPEFPVDIKKVVLAAKEYRKLIEINNHSFIARVGSEDNCKEFVKLCIENNVQMSCGSDAHISYDVGKFDKINKIFDELKVDRELLICTSKLKFENKLKDRGK